ncbi:BcatrD protein [Stachybotrys elegans]|uniref:BcatrD protein n=1 Tax=Stachybotrys elegans TaxID=80388 RepID=A0A8K0SUR4_9HYPO|nr:BcatrD protein [Stachybotrys elegans]
MESQKEDKSEMEMEMEMQAMASRHSSSHGQDSSENKVDSGETNVGSVEGSVEGNADADVDHSLPPASPDHRGKSSALDAWLQTKQHQQRLQLGVSFRDLDCNGLRVSSQYQATFLTAMFRPFKALRSRSQQQQVRILHDIQGLVKPGEMLLVLGRPGSGCSTFLKTLSGDTHGFQLGPNSSITYQDIPYDRMLRDYSGERLYLAELDVHFPELSLGQTLAFAASTRRHESLASSSSSDSDTADSSPSRTMAGLFNLDTAYDTPIGDAMIRGISGGEKRRTSIAEAYLGGARLQCWDNSTRGLDSATARQFIQILRESTDSLQSTVAMSLYQASEGMYQCFDKVMLLYEGRQIFFGPIASAEEYFTSLGFVKPPRATTPDFLTSMTSAAERIVREGCEARVPRSPDDFAKAWKASALSQSLQEEILLFEKEHGAKSTGKQSLKAIEKLGLRTSTFPISLVEQTAICLRRANQRFFNNAAPVISTIMANGVLGLIIGSAFYNLSEDSGDMYSRSILLFFATMLNSFVPAFEIDLMWAQRPIVEKQFRYAFYYPFVERLASMISDFPSKLVLSFMLHLPIYFMTNLRRTAAAFMTYWFFMLVNLMTMAMLFRMIGALSKSRDGTMTPVSILTLLCVLYTGFVVPPPYMVPWFGWFRHINPVAYTYEAVMINEFNNRNYRCSNIIPDGPAYSDIDESARLCNEVGRDEGTGLVDGTRYLDLRYGYVEGHMWRNVGILLAMMVAFCVVHLLAAEYIPAERSRGEVLVFRKAPKDKKVDGETGDAATFAQSLATNKTVADVQTATIPHINQDSASVFHWRGLTYDVKVGKGTRRILQGVDGWLKPGSLTVLMGATGAGKTTLLDVLADRVSSGQVGGTVLVDGVERSAIGSFQRRIGYVQQNDFHLPTATVRETLQFGSLLRQSQDRSKKLKLKDVEDVLQVLEMESYADAIVGVPGEGLNVEQRKRLSIALEMVSSPDLVLFLDEPTSGLDSQTAWSICMLMRKLVDNGQTILCTIHQPSAQIFSRFDRLLFLKAGATVYFGDIGPDASTLTQYFETRGARQCHAGENPAEWLLDITKRSTDDTENEFWAQQWTSSTEKQAIADQLATLESSATPTEVVGKGSRRNNSEYASPISQQLLLLVQRVFRDQWRSPTYLYTKTAVCVGLSLFNGFSFWDSDNSIQGLTNLLFSVFLVSQLFSILSMLIIPRFTTGRDLFEARERSSKAYSWVAFVAANLIVEITWLTAISVLIFVSWYYPTGMFQNGNDVFSTAERGGLTFLLVWLFTVWASTLSQVFAALIEQPETAIQLAILCFWLSLVFCGILVAPHALPGFWMFMYRVSPLTYLLEGLAIAGISGASVVCSDIELLQIPLPGDRGTCGEYLAPYANASAGTIINPDISSGHCEYCPVSEADLVLRTLGMSSEKSRAWRNLGLLAAYVVFNIVAVFAVYYLARVPKKPKSKAA